jgi:hypothetical protein
MKFFRDKYLFYSMKRSLSSSEINDICKSIKDEMHNLGPMHEDVREVVYENIKDGLVKQLKIAKIYPEKIKELKDDILKLYVKSRLSAGEMLGTSSACSISEPNSQTVLSAFHYAGVMNITKTVGLPRFKELSSVSKNPSNTVMSLSYMNIYTNIVNKSNLYFNFIFSLSVNSTFG